MKLIFWIVVYFCLAFSAEVSEEEVVAVVTVNSAQKIERR